MQTINLYRFLPRPIKSFLTFPLLLKLYALFFGLLMLDFGCGVIYHYYLKAELTTKNYTLSFEKERLNKLAALYTETELPNIATVSNKTAACKTKLSPYLQGLANTVVSGAWMTNISILTGGKEIILKGHALSANQVQQLTAKLNASQDFSHMMFQMVEVNQAETTPGSESTSGLVTFILNGKA